MRGHQTSVFYFDTQGSACLDQFTKHIQMYAYTSHKDFLKQPESCLLVQCGIDLCMQSGFPLEMSLSLLNMNRRHPWLFIMHACEYTGEYTSY